MRELSLCYARLKNERSVARGIRQIHSAVLLVGAGFCCAQGQCGGCRWTEPPLESFATLRCMNNIRFAYGEKKVLCVLAGG